MINLIKQMNNSCKIHLSTLIILESKFSLFGTHFIYCGSFHFLIILAGMLHIYSTNYLFIVCEMIHYLVSVLLVV